ncbi:MAG: DinB family protein [Gemmatimonadota bacterium]|jgi:uncharacterized damage-inducible protein DinB
MRIRWIPVLALAAAAPAAGQEMQHAEHQGNHAVAGIQQLQQQVAGWLVRSAEMMPEENYSWRPTPEVRSFGELIGHVANAQYMFCSAASGMASTNKTDFEKVAAKADLVQGIKDAMAFCEKAYQVDDAKAMETVNFFGQDGTRLWVLEFNATHNNEHYGNVVTYLRMKGLVPPSSQGGGM